ncbi:hypothetical protein MVES_003658 [Malassezia vespertilionis]|uniref:3'-5' exonuclease n=2 Tax=Malassezia vespertilionis TaxID=2020962 RepID=A0A2N1J784_9BASI|nr:hypothetical protein MVES_003658 [Malassezia vespertilionis]
MSSRVSRTKMEFAIPHHLDQLAASLADTAPYEKKIPDTMSVRPAFYSFRNPVGMIHTAFSKIYKHTAPAQPFPPPEVVYIDEAAQVDQLLPKALETTGTIANTIGFDLEWDFGPRTGKAAVMQVSTATRILIIHLSSFRGLPTSIREMMADPRIHKTGVAVRNDAHKLRRDFGLSSAGLVELSTLAKAVEPERWAHRRLLISLRDLCSAYLNETLRKDAVRTSTWSHAPLSAMQTEYAASDAYVSLELFHAIARLGYTAAHHTPGHADGLGYIEQLVSRATSSVTDVPHLKQVRGPPMQRPTLPGRAFERALYVWKKDACSFTYVAANAHIRISTVVQ